MSHYFNCRLSGLFFMLLLLGVVLPTWALTRQEMVSTTQDAVFSQAWGHWPADMPQGGMFQYLFNAPSDWDAAIGSKHWRDGAITEPEHFALLTFNSDNGGSFGVPQAKGKLGKLGFDNQLRVQPGFVAGQSANKQDRYAIIAYTIPEGRGGYYSISDSQLTKLSDKGDQIEVRVFTSASPGKPAILTYADPIPSAGDVKGDFARNEHYRRQLVEQCFDGYIGYVGEGQTIYIAIGGDGNTEGDIASLDFAICRTEPILVAKVSDIKDSLLELPAIGDTSKHPALSFTVPQSGLYALHNAWIQASDDEQGAWELRVFVGEKQMTRQGQFVANAPSKHVPINMDLGYVPKGQTIHLVFISTPSVRDASSNTVVFHEFSIVEYAPRNKPMRADDLVSMTTKNAFTKHAIDEHNVSNDAGYFGLNPSSQATMLTVTVGKASSNSFTNYDMICKAVELAGLHTSYHPNNVATIKLTDKQYRVNKADSDFKTIFYFTNMQRLIFDGQDATLIHENPKSGMFQFASVNGGTCQNVVFQNFKMDWDPLPFTQGVVLETENLFGKPDPRKPGDTLGKGYARVRYKIMPGYELPTTDGMAKSGQLVFFEIIDGKATNRRPDGATGFRKGVNPSGGPHLVHVRDRIFDQYVWVDKGYEQITDSNIRIGHGAMLKYRTEHAIRTAGDNITLNNITAYSSPGTFITCYGTDNLSILNCLLENKPGTNRSITSSADGIHGGGNGGLWLENSTISASGDDLLNIQSTAYEIFDPTYVGQTTTFKVNHIFDRKFRIDAGAHIIFVNTSDGTIIARRKVLQADNADAALEHMITINAPVFGNIQGDTIFYIADNCVNFMMRDNLFLNGSNFATVLRASNGLVLGNTYEGNLKAGIIATAEANKPAPNSGFTEGSYPDVLRIQGNTFRNNTRSFYNQFRHFMSQDPGDIIIGVIDRSEKYNIGQARLHHIRILDNVFEDWRGMGISIHNTRDLEVSCNIFKSSIHDPVMRMVLNRDPRLVDKQDDTGRYAAIHLIDNVGARVKDNIFQHHNDTKGDVDDRDLNIVIDGLSQHVETDK